MRQEFVLEKQNGKESGKETSADGIQNDKTIGKDVAIGEAIGFARAHVLCEVVRVR